MSQDLARPLARHLRLELPRASAPRTRAKCGDPFAVLVSAERRRASAARMRLDRVAWQLWMAFHRADCPARLARALEEDRGLAAHRINFFADRSLLLLAAWRGRTRCVKMLLAAGADATAADAHGCTPLIAAAWAGRAAAAACLLRTPGVVDAASAAGEPPQTSSCGGRGPKPAEEWARRKGYVRIADAIRRAGAP